MIEQYRNNYKRDQKFWTRRPFDNEMVLVSASDLLALVPQLHYAMKRCVGPVSHFASVKVKFIIIICMNLILFRPTVALCHEKVRLSVFTFRC